MAGGPPPGQVPVTGQPQGQGAPNMWATYCPPGLEFLVATDHLVVHQKIEFLEIIGLEVKNKYRIENNMGQVIYYAAEDSNVCLRQLLKANAPFVMRIFDRYGREVIELYRPFACCLQKMEVSAPLGQVIGYIDENCALRPSFTIRNAANQAVFQIKGPCWPGCDCCYVDFDVLELDGVTVVGTIQKQWTGVMQELFSDADRFGISFPMNLDVRMKAVLLGACFLIDYRYFESEV